MLGIALWQSYLHYRVFVENEVAYGRMADVRMCVLEYVEREGYLPGSSDSDASTGQCWRSVLEGSSVAQQLHHETGEGISPHFFAVFYDDCAWLLRQDYAELIRTLGDPVIICEVPISNGDSECHKVWLEEDGIFLRDCEAGRHRVDLDGVCVLRLSGRIEFVPKGASAGELREFVLGAEL